MALFQRLPSPVRTHLAALRLLLVLTVVTGVLYPLAVTAAAQLPGLRFHADGSLLSFRGRVVGSALLGQQFTDAAGHPLPGFFQPRPSLAGDGYDPTASGASNLGPEDIVDTLPDPAKRGDAGRPSLLTLVCSRSRAVGIFNGVDGRRPYCTADGEGAVLAILRGPHGQVTGAVSVNQECPAAPFIATFEGLRVRCARYGVDYRTLGRLVPIAGSGKPWPVNPVPPDAVTASASGLDPQISVAYADLQAPRVAHARHLPLAVVEALLKRYTDGAALGFLGWPGVDVLQVNLALDRASGSG